MDKPHILITGASSEIGMALLNKIHENLDCKLFITKYSNKHSLMDNDATEIIADLSNRDEILELSRKIDGMNITHYIQLQGNSTVDDTIETQSFESLDFNLTVNLNSTIMLLRNILPKMKNSEFGRIVLMNTASSTHGGGYQSFGYGLSKCGVGFVTQYLGKYYSKYNILTNCVSPGFINTKFHTKIMKRSKETLEQRVKSIRIRRAGKPIDVAKVIYELAFNNDYISGTNITIDGADFI